MAIAFSRVRSGAAGDLVVCAANGCLTDDDLKRVREQLATPAFVNAGAPVLLDFTEVRDIACTGDVVRELGRTARAGARVRLAIVATRPAVFGMARMFQTLAQEHLTDLEVCRDVDEALAWLGAAARTRLASAESSEGAGRAFARTRDD